MMSRFDIARNLPPPPPEPEKKKAGRRDLINAAIGVGIFGVNSKAVRFGRSKAVGIATLSRRNTGSRKILNGFYQIPLYPISRKDMPALRKSLHEHVDTICDQAAEVLRLTEISMGRPTLDRFTTTSTALNNGDIIPLHVNRFEIG